MEDLSNLEQVIGIKFNDPSLLHQAFTHRSFSAEARKSLLHNQRLEFLGDAVLGLITADFLYRKYPNYEEGSLTFLRNALVNGATLTAAGEKLSLYQHMFLSGHMLEKPTEKEVARVLRDTFEAIIGALWLDQGYDAAQGFIERTLYHRLEEIVAAEVWRDAKSILQEFIQGSGKPHPTYGLIRKSGLDHLASFKVALYIGTDLITTGEGGSRKEAEQDAARNALAQFNVLKPGIISEPAANVEIRECNAMSILRQRSQEVLGAEPEYRVIEETGPAHARSYLVGVYIRSRQVAKGSGGNERDASMRAAEVALIVRGWK